MRLSCRLRRLWMWAYDHGSHGLPGLWFEYFTAKKLNRACSRDSRHNRFLLLKLPITIATSMSDHASVAGTGGLWGNDSDVVYINPSMDVAGTGGLWGNDSLKKSAHHALPVAGTGGLWGNDSWHTGQIILLAVAGTGGLWGNDRIPWD